MNNNMPRCVWPEWEFVKQIGRGAYGTVYEAVRLDDFQVESRAAIKVISIPQDQSELESLRTEGMDPEASRSYLRSVVDSFVNEVKLMNSLKGVPNIVSVEDYKVVEREDEIGWDISIRMNLLTPLYSYISDKTLSEREVAGLGVDICSALEVCEKKNVIHRDIKPGNIFINEFGDYLLGDFGIARQMEGMTADYSRKGTDSYMAPEVEKGQSYNATVDLYSLGLVLYLLMNRNRLPFLDPKKQILTPVEREQAIRRRLDGETLPPPCDASPVMANIILCACAYEPGKRFSSATAMKNALETIARGTGGSGRTISATAARFESGKEEATVRQRTAPVQQRTATVQRQTTQTQDAGGQIPPTPPGRQVPHPQQALGEKKSDGGRKKKRKGPIAVIVICVIAAAVIAGLFVAQRIRENRSERYESLVENQVEYRDAGLAGEEAEAYSQAVRLFPSRLESYYQHARTLYELPGDDGLSDYYACIDFIEADILENSRIDLTQSRMADVYYIYADSLFRCGDDSGAVDAYRKLFRIGTDEALYYRDYAIALADSGYYSRAESVLSEAEDLGLGNDNIYYTLGEVERAQGEYGGALDYFAYSRQISEDEDLSARACLASAEIYRTLGDTASEREVLLEARTYTTAQMPQILQDLIQADMDLADAAADEAEAFVYRQEAIDTLLQVINNDWATFLTYNNLIVLYQREGDLAEAESTLQSIESAYASDYRWYKRAAFLEIAKQEVLTNETRDYSAFAEYEDRAEELYQAYLSDGGASDSEMSVLERQRTEVENGKWLD